MKWRGETISQWEDRTRDWHRIFCLVPRQMRNGNWVWLETCWARRRVRYGGDGFEFSDSLTAPEDNKPEIVRPPPPKAMRTGGFKP